MASTNITSSASSSSTSTLATKAVHVKKVKVEAMSYEFLEKELSPVIQHFRYVCAYLRYVCLISVRLFLKEFVYVVMTHTINLLFVMRSYLD